MIEAALVRKLSKIFISSRTFTFLPRGETEYENPYMMEDKDDILARLRRDTTNDRRNKKNYKREVPKYKLNWADVGNL